MTEAHAPSQFPASAGDWRKVLAARQQMHVPGRLVPHVGKAAIVSAGAILEPAIDSATLSATAVISTPTPDRSEDVVEPLGVRLENYAKNPVVFFDHGFSGLALPIAKSEDPNGSLTVNVTADGIEATSYFAQSMCEALQVFDLIEQKIIRSTSISMTPLLAKVRSQGSGPRPGLHIQEWDLLEWSWVGIPDNPEAVRKVLDAGKLAGSPICDPIRKCLLPFAAKSKLLGRGFAPPNSIDREDSLMHDDKLTRPEDNPVIIADDPTVPTEQDLAGTVEEEQAETPHDEFLDTDSVRRVRTAKFLADDPRASGQWLQMLRQLNGIARAKNLSPAQREALHCVASRLEAIAEEAQQIPTESAPLTESAWVRKFNDRLGLIEQKMTAAATKLLEAIPHRRP